jgi:hypothetical protein
MIGDSFPRSESVRTSSLVLPHPSSRIPHQLPLAGSPSVVPAKRSSIRGHSCSQFSSCVMLIACGFFRRVCPDHLSATTAVQLLWADAHTARRLAGNFFFPGSGSMSFGRRHSRWIRISVEGFESRSLLSTTAFLYVIPELQAQLTKGQKPHLESLPGRLRNRSIRIRFVATYSAQLPDDKSRNSWCPQNSRLSQ